jgi:hypothetical protein
MLYQYDVKHMKYHTLFDAVYDRSDGENSWLRVSYQYSKEDKTYICSVSYDIKKKNPRHRQTSDERGSDKDEEKFLVESHKASISLPKGDKKPTLEEIQNVLSALNFPVKVFNK